jgi:GTP cyclohydrolase IA
MEVLMLDEVMIDETTAVDLAPRPTGRQSSDPSVSTWLRPVTTVPTPASPPGVDLDRAECAATEFLHALGISTASESLQQTPRRMAKAYAELFAAKPFQMTTFPNDEQYDELVIARSLPMRSVCEHHLLPFTGIAHVGYLPGERILGLSKLARVVQHFAARPQVQERLTKQVADWLQTHLRPQAVGVVIVAEHSCMSLRGAEARGSTTVTSAMQGLLRTDPRCRQEFMALAGMSG